MREILFRGKAMTTDRFVEGAYYHQMEFYGDECDEHYIISSKDVLEDNMTCCDEVFPETVGQYTGLTDKNGTKIFEGDIVVFNKKRNLPNYRIKPKVVFYDERNAQFTRFESPYATLQKNMMSECEVIGNIHDNPELLKEGAENDK